MPALKPSAEADTRIAPGDVLVDALHPEPDDITAVVHDGVQYTWLVPLVTGGFATRLDAKDVKATCVPEVSTDGCELGPFAAPPPGTPVSREVVGVQVLEVDALRQVSRRKT